VTWYYLPPSVISTSALATSCPSVAHHPPRRIRRHWDDVSHMPTDDDYDHDYNDEGSEDE
jgi:hypothetical protein